MKNETEILKVSRLDVHDRLSCVKEEQSDNIIGAIKKFIEQDPFDGLCFYLFAHARKHEDGSSIRMLWQPRLLKPKAQTNSMLFRLNPKRRDEVLFVWILPERERWHLYEKGKMFENEAVAESIYNFQHNREEMEAAHPNDLDDATAQDVLMKLYPNLFKKDA